MTQTPKLARFKVEIIGERKIDGKNLAKVAFTVYGSLREEIMRERCPPMGSRNGVSAAAKRFGREIAEKLERAAAVHGMKIQVLSESALREAEIPGAQRFSAAQSVAIALERGDGRMMPFVFDRDRMLVQDGKKPIKYDSDTDFGGIVAEAVRSGRFI